jgi:hypothetical protein
VLTYDGRYRLSRTGTTKNDFTNYLVRPGFYPQIKQAEVFQIRGAPDNDLAGYPANQKPDTGYPAGRIPDILPNFGLIQMEINKEARCNGS